MFQNRDRTRHYNFKIMFGSVTSVRYLEQTFHFTKENYEIFSCKNLTLPNTNINDILITGTPRFTV